MSKYLKLAEELSHVFARRAERCDREAAFPTENFADLSTSGYTAMTVPKEHGGGGVSLDTLCRCQEQLATGCGSTAWAINMHLHGLAMLNLVDASGVTWAYEEIVKRAGIIAGGFSEPGIGGNWWYPTTRAVLEDGRYVLNGKKSFFTGFPAATMLFLTAATEDERGVLHPVGFLVPRPETGVRVTAPWDAFGMRATGSHSLAIENLRVEARYMVGKPGEVPMLFMRGVHWAWCSFTSVFVGIAKSALLHAVKILSERKLDVLAKSLAHLPGIQFRIAEMKVKLETARALLYRATRTHAGGALVRDPIANYIEVSAMKTTACRLAHEAVTLAMQVVGGSSFHVANPLQRMYRDVTAGILVPPSSDVVLEWSGKQALGIPIFAEPRWG